MKQSNRPKNGVKILLLNKYFALWEQLYVNFKLDKLENILMIWRAKLIKNDRSLDALYMARDLWSIGVSSNPGTGYNIDFYLKMCTDWKEWK